ncbi:MAG TPA: hypothetical protein VM784_14300 [Actinomycetota bacterium]|nr:hypothetical protein [Actinomycetota bacterium]
MEVAFGIVAGVVALDVAAVLFGRDSRDGEDWLHHRSPHAH